MGFKRFSILLTARLTGIMTLLMLLFYLLSIPGYHAAFLLVFLIVVGLIIEITQYVSRTNAELSRFLDAARYADFSQRFELGKLGAGFDELGETFNDILGQFRSKRTEQEEQLRHLKALLEHVPVPLLSHFKDGRLTLWNNAARRLFGTTHVSRIDDLDSFGLDFRKTLETVRPGERHLVSFETETRSYQLTLATTEVMISGTVERLISLQDIQSELDAVQLEAWQDLVRVLTHEIMNSITPVASLAQTTVDLVSDVKEKVNDGEDAETILGELDDVGSAVETVARRSDALMSFVTSYRRLTRLPAPKKDRMVIADLIANVEPLVAKDFEGDGITLETRIEPATLSVEADPGMIEQILINLLQNTRQALADWAGPKQVLIEARLNKRGQVFIRLSDSGPGIASDIADKIFVPFYTTKREGSGVGLALTRQIMIAHGGALTLNEGLPNGQKGDNSTGAAFTLTF